MNPKEMILTMLEHLDERDHHVELKIRDQFGELQDIQFAVVYFHHAKINDDDDEVGNQEECPDTGCPRCEVGDVTTKAIVIEEF